MNQAAGSILFKSEAISETIKKNLKIKLATMNRKRIIRAPLRSASKEDSVDRGDESAC